MQPLAQGKPQGDCRGRLGCGRLGRGNHSKLGICIWVMPLLPKKAMVTECEIIFLESVEIKVRLIETPVISKKINFTVYDAMAVTMESPRPEPGSVRARSAR